MTNAIGNNNVADLISAAAKRKKATGFTMVKPVAFYGSLSNLTDACQEILHMFDKGTKQNTSV